MPETAGAYDGRGGFDDSGWFSLYRRFVVAMASYPCFQTWWNWYQRFLTKSHLLGWHLATRPNDVACTSHCNVLWRKCISENGAVGPIQTESVRHNGCGSHREDFGWSVWQNDAGKSIWAFWTVQRPDESHESFVARHEVQFEDSASPKEFPWRMSGPMFFWGTQALRQRKRKRWSWTLMEIWLMEKSLMPFVSWDPSFSTRFRMDPNLPHDRRLTTWTSSRMTWTVTSMWRMKSMAL